MKNKSASNLMIVHLRCSKINWEEENERKRVPRNMLDGNQHFLVMTVCQVIAQYLGFYRIKREAICFLKCKT